MPDCPTYQELQQKAAEFERLKKDYIRSQAELHKLKETAEKNALQLESAFEHANLMAMEAQISALEFKQVFNASSDGMWVVDKSFKIRLINNALLSIFDRSDTEVIGRNCYDLLSIPACQKKTCPLRRILNGAKHVEFDINVKTHQSVIPCILSTSPFLGLDGDVIGIVASFKDITERKQAENKLIKLNGKLERLATIDSLTQIHNRRDFNRYLLQEWYRLRRSRRPLSLILCDVDFFKAFNDTYGHTCGDASLYSVAQAIRANVKRSADFVARYGGEEFAVILPETDAPGAVHVAETIRKQVHQLGIPHASSTVEPVVTISLGVSTFIPEKDLDPELIIQSADQALYQAKSEGRNRTAVQMPDRQAVASDDNGPWRQPVDLKPFTPVSDTPPFG